MRVGFVSQYFPPEPGAAAHPGTVAGAVARRGHQVRVLTGYPSYPDGVLFDGYRQHLRSTETRQGMSVVRVPYFLSHDQSGARRALSMLSFGTSSSLQSGALAGADVALVYASPATTAMAPMILRAIAGIPYVLYIQDLWPDTVIASGMLSGRPQIRDGVERLLGIACRASYRGASRIGVISPGMKSILVQRGVDPSKIMVVPNWVEESVFRPAKPDQALQSTWAQHDLTVMYAGGVGDLQGLEHALRAMELLGPSAGIHLCILGEGVAKTKLTERARSRGLEGVVTFLPSRPLESMPGAIAAADVQLISLIDRPLFHATIPSKMQASLASGMPIIAAAPGDSAHVTVASGAGIPVRPEDPEELAGAFLMMRDMGAQERAALGRRGRAYYLAEMGERAGSAALEKLLREASS